MPPPWLLTIPAWLSIAADLLSAATILYGIYTGGRQPVRIMEAVPPIQIGMMIGLATSYPNEHRANPRRRQARDAPTRAGSCGGEIAS